MKAQFIKPAAVKKLIKSHGKRTSKDFIEALDRYVERAVLRAVAEHNGGKKTIDADVAAYVLGNR